MREHVKTEWSECHFSVKSGPNGQAMFTSFEDLSLLTDKQLSDIKVLGGQEIENFISKILSHDDILGKSPLDFIRGQYPSVKSKKTTRRMVFISDPEGKTRTIGVLDYWSQTVLKTIHDSLNGILKGLKCDRTFNQERPVSVNPLQPLLSIDLKAATDSFPIEIQWEVIRALYGEKKANA